MALLRHDSENQHAVPRPIFARTETVATNLFFADTFRDRRCIVPADQYFQRSMKVQPGKRFSIQRVDGKPMAWAGLWEGHRDKDGTVTRSYGVITTETNAPLSTIHDRMPVVLEPEDWPVGLSEVRGDPASLLRPAAQQA